MKCRMLAIAVLLLAVAGCADPARVVLYDERYRGTVPAEPRQAARTSVRRKVTPSVSHLSPATTHEVRSGETVYTVALHYQVPIRGLIKLNELRAPYVLRSGQVLNLPKPRRHVIRPGDTIYRISRIYGVALSRLVQLNGIEPPYKIVAGHILRLPDSVEPPPSTEKATSSKPQIARSAPPPAKRPTAIPSLSKVVSKPRKFPTAIPKPPPLSSRKFLLPVRGRLLSGFGPKGRGLRNDGVNIAAPRGTPVRAAENGIVVYSGNALLGFGNMILVRHAKGYMTAYGHNESLSVLRGDTVRRGQVIGKVGSTGNVAAPQLHFEIRKGKRAVNPAKYLPNLASTS